MVLFQLLFHVGFDLVRVFQAHGHHPQRVADEIQGEMVLGDPGIALEDRAVVGLFDMGFQRDQALGLHGLGEQEQQAEQVAIIARLPARAGNHLAQRAADLFEIVDRAGDQHRGDGGAEDGEHFVGQGFEHDAQRAAGHQIAAEHAGEKNDNAADLKHEREGPDLMERIIINVRA